MKQEKKKARVYINPPPSDAKCECCGKHISELKPFGKAGDPLVGDFNGQLLIKTFRTMGYATKEDQKKIDLIDSIYKEEMDKKITSEELDKKLKENFSPKELERFNFLSQIVSTVGASWECRDCIILDTEEYFKKLEEKG